MVWYTSQKIFECITNFLSTLVKNYTYFLFFWSSLLVCHSSEKKFFAQWNCPFSEKLQNLPYMNIYNFYEYENPPIYNSFSFQAILSLLYFSSSISLLLLKCVVFHNINVISDLSFQVVYFDNIRLYFFQIWTS